MGKNFPPDSHALTTRERLRLFSARMAFLAVYLSLAALNYGYDAGTFQGVQAMPAFKREFGKYNHINKKWFLPSYLMSVMNSTPYFGKLVGAFLCGPIAERFGRKRTVLVLALISLIGVTIQTTAKTSAQFTLGRIINFAMTGFVVVTVPIYQAECAPAPLRGLIGTNIQFQIVFGGLVASLINYGTKDMKTDSAWLIPVGLQFVVPALILAFLPLMPESPRWLLARGRRYEAIHSLTTLRKASTKPEEIEAEIEALAKFDANSGKGPWKEVFNTVNRRRTIIAVLTLFFQQATGQAFTSQYSVVFYQQQGYSNAFLLGVITSLVGLVIVTFTSSVVDIFGRRVLLLIGSSTMAVCLMLLGGIGTIKHPNEHMKNLLVACFMLFGAGYSLSYGPIAYIILGEAAAGRVREKTNNLAVCVSTLTTFTVSFTLPYLMNPGYGNLGAKVGFIYGSTSILGTIFIFFFVPEMKGRSLEELDELFKANVATRHFKNYKV